MDLNEHVNLVQKICSYIQTLPLEIVDEEDPDRENPDLHFILEHLTKRVSTKVWERFAVHIMK